MLLGYSKLYNEYSLKASLLMAESIGFEDIDTVELESNEAVINYLNSGEIDYGVLSIYNTEEGYLFEEGILLDSNLSLLTDCGLRISTEYDEDFSLNNVTTFQLYELKK